MVVIFNLKNSHLLTLPLQTEKVFQVNGCLAISTHVKKYDIFSRVLLRLFLGLEIPV